MLISESSGDAVGGMGSSPSDPEQLVSVSLALSTSLVLMIRKRGMSHVALLLGNT